LAAVKTAQNCKTRYSGFVQQYANSVRPRVCRLNRQLIHLTTATWRPRARRAALTCDNWRVEHSEQQQQQQQQLTQSVEMRATCLTTGVTSLTDSDDAALRGVSVVVGVVVSSFLDWFSS